MRHSILSQRLVDKDHWQKQKLMVKPQHPTLRPQPIRRKTVKSQTRCAVNNKVTKDNYLETEKELAGWDSNPQHYKQDKLCYSCLVTTSTLHACARVHIYQESTQSASHCAHTDRVYGGKVHMLMVQV